MNAQELMKVLFGYMNRIATEKNVDTSLLLLADMSRDMLQADRCTLWLRDLQEDILWTKIAHGLDPIRISQHTGLVGHCIQTGEPMLIDDAYEDARFYRGIDDQTGYRTRSLLLMPIHDHLGQVMGAYQVINKITNEGKFTSTDFEAMTLIATFSAKVIESARLYQEIEETQREIVIMMGDIGEIRSRETGQHVKRVAEYSKLLALKCGLSLTEAELIKTASPMHDIGKVGIEDRILQKPAKLTPEEIAIMQTHPTIGYELLKGSKRKLLQTAALIAKEHHEKWNGSGYPEGLQGEQIHIYARITAVADVFDALASERPYKKAWEPEQIWSLFEAERGKHFDPQIVDALLQHRDEFLAIRNAYQHVNEERVKR